MVDSIKNKIKMGAAVAVLTISAIAISIIGIVVASILALTSVVKRK